MTTRTYVYSTTLTVTSCGNCGIPFAIPNDLYRARWDDGRSFCCPNGHYVNWSESEANRYRRLHKEAEDRASAARAAADQAEASRRAWKGQATKLRNRAAAGACPFCGEHVYQLSRHVARKHAAEIAADPETEPTT